MVIQNKFDKFKLNTWLDFLQKSPTAFHAANNIAKHLKGKGFLSLEEKDIWSLQEGQGYFVLKEGSIIALYLPVGIRAGGGFRLWGAHTDSPGLKIKPFPQIKNKNYSLITTEVYGGVILNTWLDRPLGIAGQVYIINPTNKKIEARLVFLEEALAIIPNAAIHLNRKINQDFQLNNEQHLRALFSEQKDDILSLIAKKINITKENILSHDLFLVDIMSPILLGANKEFINSPRLDNLGMTYAGLEGFLRAINFLAKNPSSTNEQVIPGLILFNHEEIGSQTHEGAGADLLVRVLKRFYGSCPHKTNTIESLEYNYERCLSKSFLISADMAHGFHPNFEELYDVNHSPILNKGPVIKYNANFRYSSSAFPVAVIKNIFNRFQIPFQEYSQLGTIPCGSTIGPLLSSKLAIPTLDIGNPLLAMHSIRETAGVEDQNLMILLAEKFLSNQ
jgi:aspartyl aminopeptidase